MPRVPLPDFQCGVVLGEPDTVQFPDRVVEDDFAASGGEHQSGFGAAQIGAQNTWHLAEYRHVAAIFAVDLVHLWAGFRSRRHVCTPVRRAILARIRVLGRLRAHTSTLATKATSQGGR